MQIIQTDSLDFSVNQNKFGDNENIREVTKDINEDGTNLTESNNSEDKEFICSHNDDIKWNVYQYASIPFDITVTVHKRRIKRNVSRTLFRKHIPWEPI